MGGRGAAEAPNININNNHGMTQQAHGKDELDVAPDVAGIKAGMVGRF
jgi:hypothetical protein